MNTLYSTSESLAESKFFLIEERRFFDRTRADRAASALVAKCLGLGGAAYEQFTDRAVEAGIRSRDGRGGFDFLAEQIAGTSHSVEQLRVCYRALTAGIDSMAKAA